MFVDESSQIPELGRLGVALSRCLKDERRSRGRRRRLLLLLHAHYEGLRLLLRYRQPERPQHLHDDNGNKFRQSVG